MPSPDFSHDLGYGNIPGELTPFYAEGGNKRKLQTPSRADPTSPAPGRTLTCWALSLLGGGGVALLPQVIPTTYSHFLSLQLPPSPRPGPANPLAEINTITSLCAECFRGIPPSLGFLPK